MSSFFLTSQLLHLLLTRHCPTISFPHRPTMKVQHCNLTLISSLIIIISSRTRSALDIIPEWSLRTMSIRRRNRRNSPRIVQRQRQPRTVRRNRYLRWTYVYFEKCKILSEVPLRGDKGEEMEFWWTGGNNYETARWWGITRYDSHDERWWWWLL